MGSWNDQKGWVSDDGVRYYVYLVEMDIRGSSRVDCYRRLLSDSNVNPARRTEWFADLGSRATALVEMARAGWRRYPAAIASVLQSAGH